MATSPTIRRSHWRPRFSLRSCLAIVTLLSAWLGFGVYRHRIEMAALAQINALGGEVGYRASPFYPFKSIWVVSFKGRDFDDQAFEQVLGSLSRLSNLTHLQITSAGISDKTVSSLTHLDGLRNLDLWDNAITDQGVTYLESMQWLSQLDLSATLITDQSTVTLGEMAGLQKLSLPGEPIPTPPGMVDPYAEVRAEYDGKANELGLDDPITSGVVSDASLKSLRRSLPKTRVMRTQFQYSGRESRPLRALPRRLVLPGDRLGGVTRSQMLRPIALDGRRDAA